MNNPKWWQKAVFYQIYPRSFADGNGDGLGDFPGMTAKLDYLHDLGIDAIWLSPHYPSPFLDCGYDISDYSNVAPEYGTLADFTTFLHEAHARNIRVILDLVLNHSSDQHPWFIESRASRDNAKRDWFIWRDGADGPPNNWASIFGGSAWEFDPGTGQYYYHAFLKEQPDLNWRNPEVKQAMWDMVRFWLDLGVDGFRLDTIATVFEDPDLRPRVDRLMPVHIRANQADRLQELPPGAWPCNTLGNHDTPRVWSHYRVLFPVAAADYPRVVAVWEASVRATHHFITEANIAFFRPLVLAGLPQIEKLISTRDDAGQVTAFLGMVGTKVEMLFVHPTVRGRGIGRLLLTQAIINLGATLVDVNEQNEQVVGFYQRLGFVVIGRSPLDGTGKPYPILHLQLADKSAQ